MDTTIVRQAKAVKAELQRRGWGQGAYALLPDDVVADDDGRIPASAYRNCPVCLLGAIGAAVFGSPLACDYSETPLIDALAEHAKAVHLPDWNDAPGRTVEEVYALLDSVINGDTAVTA